MCVQTYILQNKLEVTCTYAANFKALKKLCVVLVDLVNKERKVTAVSSLSPKAKGQLFGKGHLTKYRTERVTDKC